MIIMIKEKEKTMMWRRMKIMIKIRKSRKRRKTKKYRRNGGSEKIKRRKVD